MLPGRVLQFTESNAPHSRGPRHPQMVVQIGRDEELLRLRAKLISSAGYTVHSVTPGEATAEVGRKRGFSVWVFCHTLEFCELALLAVAIRNNRPQDKLLRLAGLNDIDVSEASGLFDEFLEPVMGVDELLRIVRNLAQRVPPTANRSPEMG